MSTVQRAGFTCRTDPWFKNELPHRLCGWLSNSFGPAVLPYEINSQGLGHFLSADGVRRLGQQMLLGCTTFLASEHGAELVKYVDSSRTRRDVAMTKWASLLDSTEDPFAAEARIEWYSTGQGEVVLPPERR